VEDTSKPKVASGADTYDEKAMPPRRAARTAKKLLIEGLLEAMTKPNPNLYTPIVSLFEPG
jgi:hypothetical protein